MPPPSAIDAPPKDATAALKFRPGGSIGTGAGASIGRYYDGLLKDEKRKYRPSNPQTLAVHRTLGRNSSTVEHYRLVHEELRRGFGEASGTASNSRVPWPFQQHRQQHHPSVRPGPGPSAP